MPDAWDSVHTVSPVPQERSGVGRAEERRRRTATRRLSPTGRICGAAALAHLYAASRLFVNFFQPLSKLASKTHVGAKVHKTYHAPETPYARLLVSGGDGRDEGSVCEPWRSNSTRYALLEEGRPINAPATRRPRTVTRRRAAARRRVASRTRR